MNPTKYIWKNGRFIKWEDATTHVLSHGLHYGTGVFEGVRAYNTDKGPAIFRGIDHFKRLIESAKIYQFNISYSHKELTDIAKQLIIKNNLSSCYLRPLIYKGYGELGVNSDKCPTDIIIACWEWGAYLGLLDSGIRCKVSSWARIDSRVLPPTAKASGNYINSYLAKKEAIESGYDEAILLNINGTVAEGSGENIFIIKNNTIKTPPTSDNTLKGITKDCVIKIAKNFGYSVEEESIIRDELYTADEIFLCGTAAEITPVKEIDNRIIGNHSRGPITEKIQSTYFKITSGENKDFNNWLDFVN